MDLIKDKISKSTEIINIFQSYYDFFKNGFDKLQTEVVKLYKQLIFVDIIEIHAKLIKRFSALESESFSELDLTNKQKLIFQIYYLIIKFDNIIEQVYDLVNKYSFSNSLFLDSDISSSSKYSAISREQSLKKYYITFIKRYEEATKINIVDEFFNILWLDLEKKNVDDSITQIKILNDLFNKYPNTIHLYIHLLQSLLDKYSRSKDSDNKSISYFISFIVDNNKAVILERKKEEHKLKGPANPSCRSMGLVPICEYKTINELFPLYQGKNISQIAKLTKKSIIVLYNNTNNPISYELWNLTDFHKAKHLGLNDSFTQGINDNMIKRLNTIKILDSAKWNFGGYDLYGSAEADTFYIIETLNNKHFRFLCPWNRGKEFISRFRIKGLLNYLGIIKNNTTDRISSYQKIHNKTVENMFFPIKKPDVEEIVKKSQMDVNSQDIRSTILFRLTDFVEKFVKNDKNPKKQISDIIHSKNISEIFIDVINDFYDKYIKETRIEGFKNSEILCTYLSELRDLQLIFSKETHRIYTEKKYEKEMNRIDIIQFITNIIKDALENIITQESNIYQGIMFKKQLLLV